MPAEVNFRQAEALATMLADRPIGTKAMITTIYGSSTGKQPIVVAKVGSEPWRKLLPTGEVK